MAAASISARTLSTCPVCATGVRRGNIHHVQDQGGVGDFFERGAEGFDQRGGQVPDESHRIADQHAAAGGQGHRTHGRIERGEHARIGQHGGLGQAVEQGGFSGVGVTHQGDGRQRHRLPLAAMQRASGAHVFQILFDFLDAAVDAAAVGFELRLTGAARADAAAQPGHLDAPAGQARQQVVQLRELHLQAAFPGARAAGENVEDQLRAIDDAAAPAPSPGCAAGWA